MQKIILNQAVIDLEAVHAEHGTPKIIRMERSYMGHTLSVSLIAAEWPDFRANAGVYCKVSGFEGFFGFSFSVGAQASTADAYRNALARLLRDIRHSDATKPGRDSAKIAAELRACTQTTPAKQKATRL